ncbi:ankyrin repeat-containing domain protein [Paraphoma chrysanthemicola]|uniref:Ankyrin repeat-containing domain protein n=1 Tax=Paraphoma chrysanthemicola TaxID=798071 RepID=A0A8K0R7R4_9PLEO|nr:ankyrin repeat-containing domain protein [Paraphoma chrysanthemicola]
MTSYHYTPLANDGHSIRLLRLLPAPNEAIKVKCKIFHSQINNASQPRYEALSYTWGDASKTVDIGLSTSEFPATVNLEAALRALRQKDKVRVLWVDAICINQGDVHEQGAQVRMMWDIYKAADRVVVWLGPEEGDSAVAMDNIARRDCSKKIAVRNTMRERPPSERSSTWCGCHAGDFATHPSRTGVQQLLNSRWLTRVWVLQEVAAAKDIVIVCGNRTVTGKDFYHELVSLSSWIATMHKQLRKTRPVLELMDQSNQSLSAGSLPLLELMESFRSWDATKPVDKLFALLSFSSDASQAPELQPDYTVPEHIIARRIVRFALPACVIQDTPQAPSTEVTFEIDGFLLGEITSKMSGRVRDFTFAARESEFPGAVYSAKVKELFDSSVDWNITIKNERRLELGNTVVLLRGASRPTILSFRNNKLSVIMLAAPEPTKAGTNRRDRVREWDDIVAILSKESKDLMKFTLSWDPFRKPHASELSKHTLSPNDPIVQWEAMIESMKEGSDDADGSGHNCRTLVMLRMSFNQDKDAIKAGTSKFTTTLHKAAYNGFYETVKLLLDAKADVNECMSPFGTPLHLAVIGGHTKVVQALLGAHARIDITDGNGQTAFELATRNGTVDMIRMFLDAGAIFPQAKTRDKNKPEEVIFDLAINGNADEVRKLLKSGDVDPNTVTNMGGAKNVTGLHVAAEMGRTEVVAAFLEAGAVVNATTSQDTTPLHQASMNGHSEVVELLLRAGAHVNAQDENGTTPLDFALYRKQLATARTVAAAGGQTFKLKS